jgi:phosphoglucosamine mutase
VIFSAHTTTGDGLVTALQLAHAIVASGRSLSDLASIVQALPQVLVNVRVSDAARVAAEPALTAAVAAEEAALGGEGRVLVRASGTEPLVRVMVEASDGVVAQAIADRLAGLAFSLA